ncbi:MAG TPA: ribonuclease HIII, partial [Candidatus Atribacteria bacterium]|nr:ribonuclease HIII [Candidatus Atribacteria bacterium]
DEKDKLYDFLKKQGFSFKNIDYAFFRATKGNLNIIFYRSGKLLIQGREKDVDLLYNSIEGIFLKKDTLNSWMGTDEAGKGDYFGPLVVAGVIIKREDEGRLLKIGVKDSKRLKSNRIKELANYIKSNFLHDIIVLEPNRYNILYDKEKNLNLLLSELHIKIIERLRRKTSIEKIVVDKFSKNSSIVETFRDKVEIEEIVGGERDLACASASILARSAFIEYMEEMSKIYDFKFPKGSGKPVKEAVRLFLEKYPASKLKNVAKLHFKITREVLDG